MSTENFNSYSKYYDLLYKDKDYESESAYVEGLVKTYQPNAKNILELGCGTGNHAAILCRSGYDVTGLERSADMVELANKKGIPNFHPRVADIIDFKVGEKFDVAISLFHVLSYLTDNKDLLSCFKAVYDHLNLNGIFVFDVWYTPAVYVQQPLTRVKRISNNEIEVTRIAESDINYNSNTVDVNYQIIIKDISSGQMEVHNEKHPMRHFSIPEIEVLAVATNFEVIKTEEFQTHNSPGSNTWGVCFVLKKK
ncbi:MAG: class I SAM-dependent methyltransferase [Bacteroidota bacterium]